MILSFLLGWRLQCYLTLYDSVITANVIWLCSQLTALQILPANSGSCAFHVTQAEWHSPRIPINQRQSSCRERLMGKFQRKAQWRHILKLREWCWLVKYIIVHFWIGPDVQNSKMLMFSMRILYHLKASHEHVCGRRLEGLSHLLLSYEGNNAETIFCGIYKNIFQKNWIFAFFP